MTLNPRLDPQVSPGRYLLDRLRQHWRWGRTQGWGRLIEEDQLDPIARARQAATMWRWRRRHGVEPGASTPVYVVGLQRSGTNMLVRGLDRAPEFEVHNENDRAVFERFRLRSDEVVRATVLGSRHAYVLFKPLCDSARVAELLAIAAPERARAVWIYRDVDSRVRSSLAKFGSHNLDVLRAIATDQAEGRWQAEGLDDEARELARSFDLDRDPPGLSPESASALFWYLRNRLYFTQGLPERADVHLTSYEAFLEDPTGTMRRLCDFLGFPYRPELVQHVEARSAGGAQRLEIDPRVRQLCADLTARLAAARAGVST